MNWRLAWLDYLATLRRRRTWLGGALMVYAVLAIPVLFQRPPRYILEAVTTWFGTSDPGLLFLYVWTDMAMNKAILMLAVAFGSDVVLSERERGVLELCLSKPLRPATYYLLRSGSACAVVATIYLATQFAGAVYFTFAVRGFSPGPFLLSGAVHVGAAVFATAFASMLAVTLGRRSASAVGSVFLLGVMVGLSFIGFYQPAWKTAASWSPFALAVQGLVDYGAWNPASLLRALAGLALWTALCLGLGVWRVRTVDL